MIFGMSIVQDILAKQISLSCAQLRMCAKQNKRNVQLNYRLKVQALLLMNYSEKRSINERENGENGERKKKARE